METNQIQQHVNVPILRLHQMNNSTSDISGAGVHKKSIERRTNRNHRQTSLTMPHGNTMHSGALSTTTKITQILTHYIKTIQIQPTCYIVLALNHQNTWELWHTNTHHAPQKQPNSKCVRSTYFPNYTAMGKCDHNPATMMKLNDRCEKKKKKQTNLSKISKV